MTTHLFFYLSLSFLFLHEMDAIRCKEWTILPMLSLLNDKLGFRIFVLLHIPLYFILIRLLSSNENIDFFIKAFDIFMIIHIGLHLLLIRNKKNEFKDFFSWSIIILSGLFGFLDIIF